MTQNTDDILDGIVCQQCGQFMEDFLKTTTGQIFSTPGYPRTCQKCSKSLKPTQ